MSSPAAGACRVAVKVNGRNTGQTITSGWNATYAPASGPVTARNVAYNGSIAPGAGASAGIGFQAVHTGNSAAPTGFALNGAACTTGRRSRTKLFAVQVTAGKVEPWAGAFVESAA